MAGVREFCRPRQRGNSIMTTFPVRSTPTTIPAITGSKYFTKAARFGLEFHDREFAVFCADFWVVSVLFLFRGARFTQIRQFGKAFHYEKKSVLECCGEERMDGAI